jgi:hypothetical protein
MAQAHSLRNVPSARTPDQRILEGLFQSPVYLIAYVLYGRIVSHDERFVEIWLLSFSARVSGSAPFQRTGPSRADAPLRVYPHEPELLPAPVDHILDAKIELAAHDACIRLSGQLVEKVHADRIDFVVYVETDSEIRPHCPRCRARTPDHLTYFL